MSKLFFIIGKTGSGKSTIVDGLLANRKYKSRPLTRLVMYTTRPKRPREVEGQEYHFVDVDTLMNKVQNGEILEHRLYETDNGYWYYATPKFKDNDTNYISQGTPEMYNKYRDILGDKVIPILLVRDEHKRVSGLIDRELEDNPYPDLKEVYRRLYTDEIDFKGIYDIVPKANIFRNCDTIGVTLFGIMAFIDYKLKEES